MDMQTSPLALLKDPTLLKTDALINGQWVTGSDRFAVTDPATGGHLASVANLGAAEAGAVRRIGSFERLSRDADGVCVLHYQARDRAGTLASEGKAKTSDALSSLGKIVADNAGTLDEKLGVKYGDYLIAIVL